MKSNSDNILRNWLQISKLTIMLPVSLTGFTGYFIFNPQISIKLISVSFGILLMAISASVLNQIQEVDLDIKMNRTLYRPIPARKIELQQAYEKGLYDGFFRTVNYIDSMNYFKLGNIEFTKPEVNTFLHKK